MHIPKDIPANLRNNSSDCGSRQVTSRLYKSYAAISHRKMFLSLPQEFYSFHFPEFLHQWMPTQEHNANIHVARKYAQSSRKTTYLMMNISYSCTRQNKQIKWNLFDENLTIDDCRNKKKLNAGESLTMAFCWKPVKLHFQNIMHTSCVQKDEIT